MNKFDLFASKLANQQIVRAIRRGLILLMPFILIGSFVLALLNLPIPVYQKFLLSVFGTGIREIGLSIQKATLQIISITTLITVSYTSATEKNIVASGEVNSIIIVITTVVSYIAFTNHSNLIISVEDAGTTGMFGALIVSVLSCNLFCFIYKCYDRIQPTNKMFYHGSTLIQASFHAVIPAFITIFIFCTAKELLEVIRVNEIQEKLLQELNEKWMTGYNFLTVLFLVLVTQVLWFFGIHGGNLVMDAVSSATPVITSVSDPGIFTKGFYDTYVYLGGSGATLGLLCALLLIKDKSSEYQLAKASILPSIFNINETMIYGFPIIFNPFFFLPFLLAPVVLSITAGVAVSMGWVPPVTQAVEWTTPIFISGYLGTGSAAGIIMQAVNLLLTALIYLPFIRLQANYQKQARIKVFQSLVSEIQSIQEMPKRAILARHDEIGSLARALVQEIKASLKNNTPTVHLEYQPKVNYHGDVRGAEALLRWMHPIYGSVSPCVILSICEEAGLANELGLWIMKQAVCDLALWHRHGYDKVTLSVNLSPEQLQKDHSLIPSVKSNLNLHGIEPGYLELELTENAAIDPSESTRYKLEQLKALGVDLSIDDFGMGHSSLLYLCDFYANIVKLDVSLVRTITSDRQRRQIVISILSLCNKLNVKVVAEGVETKEQVQLLHELGCDYYQGFYFSKSLTCEHFLEYVEQHKMAEDDNLQRKASR